MNEKVYTYFPQKLSVEEVSKFAESVQWNSNHAPSPTLVSRLFYSGQDDLYDYFEALGLSGRQILHISQAYTYHASLKPERSVTIQSIVKDMEWKEKWIKLVVYSKVWEEDTVLLMEATATYFCEKREGDEWRDGKLHSL